ncbi:2,3-bisphosphoglycerate-independent phosphoglycerate mutase [soil metagenome]
MDQIKTTIKRPVALVILDGWGFAPRTDGNAIAIAHTPFYDEICRKYPMTTLAASGVVVGQSENEVGTAEVGHLNIGTGRIARTDESRIKASIASGEFLENIVINDAFNKAKNDGSAVHFIGLLSDGGVHSSTENLFALLRMAKRHGIDNVFVHAILDGVDVQPRTADIYVEALEIKMAEIGVGHVASLCGRFFAMDSRENWERTARAFTMLVHAEGERVNDAVGAIRNSFLRGISDEFISPIVVERTPDEPVATVESGDLVVFFNHRADAMRQLVRSLSVPEGASGAKPTVSTVCLTDYDRNFNLPAAYKQEPEKNTLTEVLSELEIPNIKITEAARVPQLTHFFDGGNDAQIQFEQQVIVSGKAGVPGEIRPESQSFKITDNFRQSLESTPNGVFIVNFPAADMMAATGDFGKTVASIQYVDTCLGGICERMKEAGGVVLITSTHGNCEEMVQVENGEPNPLSTLNPVPFHYVDAKGPDLELFEGRSLQDIAPTILGILEIEKPIEMTGRDIRRF